MFQEAGLGEVVLMEGGPQTTPTSTAAGGVASGPGGRGEGGRMGKRASGKSAQPNQAASSGSTKKPTLNPLAVVTSSGEPLWKVTC